MFLMDSSHSNRSPCQVQEMAVQQPLAVVVDVEVVVAVAEQVHGGVASSRSTPDTCTRRQARLLPWYVTVNMLRRSERRRVKGLRTAALVHGWARTRVRVRECRWWWMRTGELELHQDQVVCLTERVELLRVRDSAKAPSVTT